MRTWLGGMRFNFATGVSGLMRFPQVPAPHVFLKPLHPSTPCPVFFHHTETEEPSIILIMHTTVFSC